MAVTANQLASCIAYLKGVPVTGDTAQAECFMLAKIAGSTDSTILGRANAAAAQVAAQVDLYSVTHPELVLIASWASL